jgi:hypothetical protein
MVDWKKWLRLIGRSALRIMIGVLISLVVLFFIGWIVMIHMPGTSYSGPLPELTQQQKSLGGALRRDVEKLSVEIGSRNVFEYEKLKAAEAFIESSLIEAGYKVRRQEYKVEGKTCANLEVEIEGSALKDEVVVVGAHYDTVQFTPGADDNASAVAGLLALARFFSGKQAPRTLRLVAFVNEEPPWFHGPKMGSLVYAHSCKDNGDKIVAMLCLEMLGYYTDEPDSQDYPPPLSWFYPSTGNFIAFVGNISSRSLVHKAITSFRQHTKFPSEGVAIFAGIPGVSLSDHWSFWQIDAPAIMVTDTAFYRNQGYHEETDTADKLDYDRMARVVSGLEHVIKDILNSTD